MPPRKSSKKQKEATTYNHTEETPQRPDIGTEAQFKKRKSPTTYRYDSSIAPSMEWDNNPVREEAEALIQQILEADDIESAKLAATKLKKLTQPFLNWTGKAERLSFDVPTLPLFVHERLSTRAIIETLKSHQSQPQQLSLFSDPQWSITDQILKAYEYKDKWVNRMILGDSLVTMNSLLQYEGMGGQVQMIYIDPPYGVKFGSNFQPFVRKRDVKHNDDNDLTREPETVKAYRDTWELGLHSYLSYLRDRLLLARELLTESGSVFVQIGEENVHHVRELMDEVFGSENFISQLSIFKTTTPRILLDNNLFYILWYSKEKTFVKYNQLFIDKPCKEWASETDGGSWGVTINRKDRPLTPEEKANTDLLPDGALVYQLSGLTSDGSSSDTKPFFFEGKEYYPGAKNHWKTSIDGLQVLAQKNRIEIRGQTGKPWFKKYHRDFPIKRLTNVWTDTSGKANERLYVVQTQNKVIERCLLMTTDPSDLVLDITCGSGTTAYVAEQWGRRWITCDVSRVPLALARQRLLTATFPYYQLKDGKSPSGGFVYKRKQNRKGEEIGGIVPHITLKSIANNEPPDEEILVDKPEIDNSYVRVCSPFTIEGTIAPTIDIEGEESETVEVDNNTSFTDRMLEILRQSPILHLPDNKTVELTNVRQPAKSQNINAEALVKASALGDVSLSDAVDEVIEQNQNQLPLSQKPVAFLFGSENGAIAERTVYETAKEAETKGYNHLYVIGFAISANARQFIEHCKDTMGIPATYIQATPDLLMGDLLKNMRSSQIFSVCGLPDIKVNKLDDGNYQVELLGLDVFDPVTMDVDHEQGNNVPAWFLDTDYNGLCFYVKQAFFPRTSAWDSIKKALKGTYDDEVWSHLAGTVSKSFEKGEHNQIAVKVIDDRGNELLVVKELKNLL